MMVYVIKGSLVFDLSIIIVTYNPGNILYDCLHSLANGVSDLHTEVIVVDNASQDGVVQRAAEQFPHVKFIYNADNKGFAGGNNQGLALASGRHLLLLNPDVIVKPGSLKNLADFLEANPSVGIVGPRTFDGTGKPSLTAHIPYTALSIIWKYAGLNTIFPYYFYGRFRDAVEHGMKPVIVAWVQGCCLMVRRNVFEKIGGLDEKFFLFAEEPDFCERALQAGWKACFVPTSQIIHFESTAVSRYPERKIRAYHISPLHYFRKRGQWGQVWLLKVGFSAELTLKTGIRVVQMLLGRPVRPLILIYGKILKEVWRY